MPDEIIPLRLLPSEPLFVPGETMSFELTYQDVLGGRAVLAVGKPGMSEGRRILIVSSLFETAGVAELVKDVRDEFHTQLDAATGAPVGHHGTYHSGKNLISSKTEFVGDVAKIEYVRNDDPPKRKQVKLPEGELVHDVHSIIGALRAWQPEPGDAVYFYSISGRRVWRSVLRFVGRETVRTGTGLQAALRLEGVATRLTYALEPDPKKKPRDMLVWLSDDDARLPVRMVARTEYGELKAVLVDYQRPEERVSQR